MDRSLDVVRVGGVVVVRILSFGLLVQTRSGRFVTLPRRYVSIVRQDLAGNAELDMPRWLALETKLVDPASGP